jgi:hypothetical protein
MAKTVSASKSEWTLPAVLVKATTTPAIVTVPGRVALAIDGRGDPNSVDFQQAVAALYGVAYGLKFAQKKSGKGTPFKVAALEGRWSAENWTDPSKLPPRERWTWRLRMGLPPDVDEAEIADMVRALTSKKGGKLEGSAAAGRIFLERIPEAKLGRILHVGPYADEPRSFAALITTVAAAGLHSSPWHLEIYLGDPRRAAPDKLKTVLLKEVSP